MAKMREKSPGCHIVTFAPHDGKDGRGQYVLPLSAQAAVPSLMNCFGRIPMPLMLPIWRGVNSLSLLIDKKEKG